MKSFFSMDSPLGRLLITLTPTEVVRVEFEDLAEPSEGTSENERLAPTGAALKLQSEVARQLDEFWARKRAEFSLPLASRGTPFQRRVWAEIRSIPFGTTKTYLEVAQILEAPGAVRAVGAAAGENPWCLVVPCHRVIGANGKLTGYAGGIDRKRRLLNWETEKITG